MMVLKQQLVSLPWLSLLWPALSAVAFTFTNTIPTQCDPLTINWTGGHPPFQFLMIAPGRQMYNFTVPTSSFNNNAGSFTIPQLLLPQFQRVMFSMSDATGVSSGGITSLLTVGDSVSSVLCNTTSASPDFFFTSSQDLEECKPFEFSDYPDAVQPVTIFGFIPNGTLLTLFPPLGDHFNFINNLTAGTSVVFYMEDSLGRDGGVANTDIVSLSDDTSCVSSTGDPNSTSTTSNPTIIAPNSPPTTTSSSTRPFTSTSKSSNVAVIVGSAAGGGFAVVLLGIFVGCCVWRRRRRDRSRSRLPIIPEASSMDLMERADQGNMPNVMLQHQVIVPVAGEASSSTSRLTATWAETGMGTGAAPTRLDPLSGEEMRLAIMNGVSVASGQANTHGRAPSGYPIAQTSAGTNSGQGGSEYGPSSYVSLQPSREGLLTPGMHHSTGDPRSNGHSKGAQKVIVHTDIAETQLMDDVDEQPLELPPTYSEARRPIPGLLSSDIPTNKPSSKSRSRKGP